MEIDRILSKGIIPGSFLGEDIQCDFKVDINRKKLWLVELDLLLELDRVCKKHNLTYFLIFGTLLGAVRHQGFVPWDDDIDVAMPRKDYEKLLLLTSEFDFPYYLQTPYSHDGSCFSFTKLRNGNTCAVSKKFCYESFNQGIWIDINPLDSYNMEGAEEKFTQVKQLGVDLGTYMRRNNPELDEIDKMRVANYSGRKPEETIQMIQDICRSQENDNYPYMGIMVAGYYTYDKQTYRKNWFEGSADIIFCGFNFPVPQGYIEVLKTTYGDFNKMPPKEKRVAWHPNEIFDTDVSYKIHLKSL